MAFSHGYVRFFSAFLLSALAAFGAYAGGAMSGEHDICVMHTSWFDIIYPKRVEDDARYLAESADEIYDSVCTLLGCEKRVRYPVTIAPARENYNAFYTQFFANHIVLYDSPATRDALTSSDIFLNTFKHELTHAVMCNMRSSFWRGAGHIFGDGALLGAAIITMSHWEGIAVVSESADGEGRLNDPYSFTAVRQAKIEGIFPHYGDIYGARTSYPRDVYYSFGASFDDYIRIRYGMEKYAAFWYKCLNTMTIHQSFAFKQVFGISMKEAWQDFYDSIDVSHVKANTDDEEHSLPPDVASEVNPALGARYDYLSRDERGDIAYCDRVTGAVYFNERTDNGFKKRQHLFTPVRSLQSMINGVRLSSDGAFVAVSIVSTRHLAQKAEVRIFDIKRKRWFRLPSTGLFEGSIITIGREHYAFTIHAISQSKRLLIWKLDEQNGKLMGGTIHASIPLERNDAIYDITDAEGGDAACVLQSGNTTSFLFINAASQSARKVMLPEKVKVRDISLSKYDYNEREYLFSYIRAGDTAHPAALPRLGILHITQDDAQCTLSDDKDDISGGITCPVRLDDNVLYIGQFYKESRLLAASLDDKRITDDMAISLSEDSTFHFPSMSAQSTIAQEPSPISAPSAASSQSEVSVISKSVGERYNPFRYILHGMWLPVSVASIYNHDAEKDKWLPLGISMATSSPWFNGYGYALLSAGYLDGNGAIEGKVTGGTDTQIFRYEVNAQVAMDMEESTFKQTTESLILSSSFPISLSSALSLTNETHFIYDRKGIISKLPYVRRMDSNATEVVTLDTDMEYTYTQNFSSVSWNNIRQVGESNYEKGGVGCALSFNAEYSKLSYELHSNEIVTVGRGDIQSSDYMFNPSVMLQIALPRLLPFRDTSEITMNIPITGSIALFPSGSKFLQHTESATLFGYEVQKAIPFASIIFINTVALEVSYTGKVYYTDKSRSWAIFSASALLDDFIDGEMAYRDTLFFDIALTATPNYGVLTTLHLTIRGGIALHLNKDDTDKDMEGALYCTMTY